MQCHSQELCPLCSPHGVAVPSATKVYLQGKKETSLGDSAAIPNSSLSDSVQCGCMHTGCHHGLTAPLLDSLWNVFVIHSEIKRYFDWYPSYLKVIFIMSAGARG